jgi:hypothetical protein
MAAVRSEELERFVSEALELEAKERLASQHPANPFQGGIPFPEISEDKIAAAVSRELSTPEHSQEQLLARLHGLQYPYAPPNQQRPKAPTFYQHVQKTNLLTFLLEPPFLWEVRIVWSFRLHHKLQAEHRHDQESQYGYQVAFHREMMSALTKQLGNVRRIADKYKVPRDWFDAYYRESLKLLLRETSVIYPEWRMWRVPVSRLRPRSLRVESQLHIFDAITKELTKRKTNNHQLTRELTALICSPQSCVRTKILEPNPETVRMSVRDRRKSGA